MADHNLSIGDRIFLRGSRYDFEIVGVDTSHGGEIFEARAVHPVTGSLDASQPFRFRPEHTNYQKLGSLAAFL